jgi:hypothetical protein
MSNPVLPGAGGGGGPGGSSGSPSRKWAFGSLESPAIVAEGLLALKTPRVLDESEDEEEEPPEFGQWGTGGAAGGNSDGEDVKPSAAPNRKGWRFIQKFGGDCAREDVGVARASHEGVENNYHQTAGSNAACKNS